MLKFERETMGSSVLKDSIFERLRTDIISAKLSPGEKLKVEYLRKHYGTSGSPVREALNRLVAEGLVHQQDRRGFRVASVSLEDLEELTRTRQWIEQLTVRESIRNGGAEWEAEVVLAYHRLARAPGDFDSEGKKEPSWKRCHREFHRAVSSACGSRSLLNFSSLLFDSAERYRELAASTGHRDDLTEHREIMEAALDRDVERTCALMDAHMERTANSIVGIFKSRPSYGQYDPQDDDF